MSKLDQIWHGVSHGSLESKRKRIFGIACLEKSSYFNRKYRFFRLLFAYSIFKNIEISSVQGVDQTKPNLEWSIPCVSRV